MAKQTILIRECERMSAFDLAALDDLPESIGANLYTEDDRKLINTLHKRYIERLTPFLWQTYSKKSDRYLQTGKQPNQAQAKHTLLVWYRDYLDLEEKSVDEQIRQLWIELGKSDGMPAELLQKMYSFNYKFSTYATQ